MDTNPHYPDMPVLDEQRIEYHYIRALNIVRKAREKREPVFVLRARDTHAIPALREYMNELEKFTPPGDEVDDLYDSMVELVTDFIEWQKVHGTKHPDL